MRNAAHGGRADRAARVLCRAAARLRTTRSRPRLRRHIRRGFRTLPLETAEFGLLVPGAAGGSSLRAGRHLCARRSCRARALHVAACARHGRVGSAHRAVRSRGAHPRARSGGRLPRDGRSHTHPLPADRGAAGAADGRTEIDIAGRARARAQSGEVRARRHVGWFCCARCSAHQSPRRRVVHRRRRGGDAALSLLLGFATKACRARCCC